MGASCQEDNCLLFLGSEKINYKTLLTLLGSTEVEKVDVKFSEWLFLSLLTFRMLGREPSGEKSCGEKCQI